ncbi:MAG TPA: methyltransferase domain-containing protein [Anaerolineae bacterium]|nr:methyltransferase domain-containing protein [Anaerolineae bacterium]
MTDIALPKIASKKSSPVPYTLPRGILLHVGCGPVIPDGWVNVDASWNLRAAHVPGLRRVLKSLGWISDEAAAHEWSNKIRFCDVSRGLPFADGSVAVIYASHVLEHIRLSGARTFMREAHRVLATEGILRLVVPDLERLARLYLEQKKQGGEKAVSAANDFMRDLMTCRDYSQAKLPLKLYRAYFDTMAHKWMYDADSLQQLFEEAGFREIRRCSYLESRVPMIADVERPNRFSDGICVEGVR